MKILIVDDEVISRKVMQATCEQLGYQVVTAANGLEALEAISKNPFRLIVSDWVMPEMDGLELCQKVRALPGVDYTFFFLITGRKTNWSNYYKAMETGVDDFVYKPVDPDVFRNQLRVAERVLGLINGQPAESVPKAA